MDSMSCRSITRVSDASCQRDLSHSLWPEMQYPEIGRTSLNGQYVVYSLRLAASKSEDGLAH